MFHYFQWNWNETRDYSIIQEIKEHHRDRNVTDENNPEEDNFNLCTQTRNCIDSKNVLENIVVQNKEGHPEETCSINLSQ